MTHESKKHSRNAESPYTSNNSNMNSSIDFHTNINTVPDAEMAQRKTIRLQNELITIELAVILAKYR